MNLRNHATWMVPIFNFPRFRWKKHTSIRWIDFTQEVSDGQKCPAEGGSAELMQKFSMISESVISVGALEDEKR